MSKFLDQMLRPEAAEEDSDPELGLLWWLFRHKNVMPWEAYEHIRLPGCRELVYAFAARECESWVKK